MSIILRHHNVFYGASAGLDTTLEAISMTDPAKKHPSIHDAAFKAARVSQTQAQLAQERFHERVQAACNDNIAGLNLKPRSPRDIRAGGACYAPDFTQRSIRFRDTSRQRGNNFAERADRHRIHGLLGSAGSRQPRVVATK
jgi:hypothetical protein